jgi:hypothetical protein
MRRLYAASGIESAATASTDRSSAAVVMRMTFSGMPSFRAVGATATSVSAATSPPLTQEQRKDSVGHEWFRARSARLLGNRAAVAAGSVRPSRPRRP